MPGRDVVYPSDLNSKKIRDFRPCVPKRNRFYFDMVMITFPTWPAPVIVYPIKTPPWATGL